MFCSFAVLFRRREGVQLPLGVDALVRVLLLLLRGHGPHRVHGGGEAVARAVDRAGQLDGKNRRSEHQIWFANLGACLHAGGPLPLKSTH